MKTKYLCYDIRGIQSFIFKIPRLKYIIGGSALIDRFDRTVVPDRIRVHGAQLLAAGGGKGAYRVRDAKVADELERRLMQHAHEIGVDIRFGRSHEYSEAANCASRLYPYLPAPDALEGHPCPDSGLFPVPDGKPHRVVRRRKWSRRDDMTRWFEDRLRLDKTSIHPEFLDHTLAFMRNVNAEDEDDQKGGLAGFRALGERNRWAVICMDGNDMGRQFQAMGEAAHSSDDFIAWLEKFSGALDDCTFEACRQGIFEVLRRWASEPQVAEKIREHAFDDEGGELVVPVRPLVVGGDDITVLCHAAYATAFVQRACSSFEKYSRQLAAQERERSGIELWPRTRDHVTISAGILYCATSLPLATAIPYAHDLLSLAKGRGRERVAASPDPDTTPSPACVDFEAVTESMLDSPRARRMRELVFIDEDADGEEHQRRIELTCRPYLVEQLCALEAGLQELRLPRTMLHRLLPGLCQGKSDRQVFYARLGKRNEALRRALDETKIVEKAQRWWRGERPSHWFQDSSCRRTDLIDMVILAKESHRMSEEAAR